ncbi:ankyrin repeat-containing domain protein [Mariannaea sp. PMI_226]|nr:ankyrin repeat-containing domain protein [Mariannaea sp. PMI_226]
MTEILQIPALLLGAQSQPPKSNQSLQIQYAAVYQYLIGVMPESFENQHLARSQAITGQLGDTVSVTCALECLLYLTSNNIPFVLDFLEMDKLILHVVEYLLSMQVLLGNLASLPEPTAQALAGRIFAAAVRLSRVTLLRRLNESGFEIRAWTRRQIQTEIATVKGAVLWTILPMHISLMQSDVCLTKFLLRHGANINDVSNVNHSLPICSIQAAVLHNRNSKFKPKIIDWVLQHPDLIVTEERILLAISAISIYNERLNFNLDIAAPLLSHLQQLKESRGLMYTSWVLGCAIQCGHQDLIDAMLLEWNPLSKPPQLNLGGTDWWYTDYTPPNPLWEAVSQGNYTLCKLLLDAGMKPAPRDPNSPSALHIAAYFGEVEILQLLIAHGAEINRRMSKRPFVRVGGRSIWLEGTALTCSFLEHEEQASKLLLEAGAGFSIRDLDYALFYGSDNICIQILEFGLEIPDKESPQREDMLAKAIGSRKLATANHILNLDTRTYYPKALVEATQLALETKDISLLSQLLSRREKYAGYWHHSASCESIALAKSVYDGNQALVSLLVDHGLTFSSDVRHFTQDLRFLAIRQHSSWISHRVRYRASQNLMRIGCSLIGVAFLGKQEGMVGLLSGCGHQLLPEDLYCTIDSNNEAATMKLLQEPSVVATKDDDWPSLLPIAIEKDMDKVVNFMLEQRINVNAFSAEEDYKIRRTAIQAASQKGDIALMGLLINLGANVDAKAWKFQGATALQYAVTSGFIGAVKLLIESGADCNAPGASIHGRTALEAAGEHGRIDIIQLLLISKVSTTGQGQIQYLRAVKFAEAEGHHAAAKLLKDYRVWTEEDKNIFRDVIIEDSWDFDAIDQEMRVELS